MKPLTEKEKLPELRRRIPAALKDIQEIKIISEGGAMILLKPEEIKEANKETYGNIPVLIEPQPEDYAIAFTQAKHIYKEIMAVIKDTAIPYELAVFLAEYRKEIGL